MKWQHRPAFIPHLALIFVIGSLGFSTSILFSETAKQRYSNDMSNTVGPILSSVAENTCYGVETPVGKGAVIMTKREKRSSCIGGFGNAVYARCFDKMHRGVEGFDESLGVRWYAIPTRDIPIYEHSSYSCIDHDKVHLPELYNSIRLAEIGEAVIKF